MYVTVIRHITRGIFPFWWCSRTFYNTADIGEVSNDVEKSETTLKEADEKQREDEKDSINRRETEEKVTVNKQESVDVAVSEKADGYSTQEVSEYEDSGEWLPW